MWTTDHEMFELIKSKLYTPVVGDILDQMGYYHQFLPQAIRPLKPDMKLAGWAMTALMIDVFGPQEQPFGKLTEALDQIQENEIYIAAGGTMRCAYWGELLTATARTRKGVGAGVDGWHRDTPQDSSVRTQVVDYRCRLEIGQVRVESGDLIFGDIDGVLVIPRKVAREVLEKALEKAATEKTVRKAIEGGMTCTEAFRVYGVL